MCRNTINGKCYVGKSVVGMGRRKAWHYGAARRGEGWCLHNAIRKYGEAAFEWEVLFESDDPDELGRMECACIAERKTRRPGGYNLTDGGDGVRGRDPEATERIAAFHRGRKRSDETRKRISDVMKGKRTRLGSVCSEETRKKIAASLTGRQPAPETVAKIAAFMRGRPKSAAQKAKMAEARRRWWENQRAERQHRAEQRDLFAAAAQKEAADA